MTDVAVPRPSPRGRIRRWSRLSATSTAVAVAILGLLALAPEFAGSNVVLDLTNLVILVILAVMWNALAGFGGMVSIGQQAFIGLGAYGTVYLVQHGQHPYIAMLEATIFCGVFALPLSVFMLRLRSGPVRDRACGWWPRRSRSWSRSTRASAPARAPR